MKYLILENHMSYSIALDEAGRFVKVANMNYEIGDRVDRVYPIELEVKSNNKKIFSIVATIAACFILIFTTMFNTAPAVTYASIYMSINPELRMDVSQEGMVVDIEALNEDGKKLIKGYSWKKKSMDTTSKELIDRAIDLGFLSSGGMVKIDINSPDEIWYQDTGVLFRKSLDEYTDERLSITIEINKLSDDEDVESPVRGEDTKPEVVIPVAPVVDSTSKPTDDGDSDYDGDSKYGDSDYDDDRDEIKENKVINRESKNKDTDYGDSIYETEKPNSNYGNSDYDDKNSDYEKQNSNYDDDDSDYDD